MEERPSKRILIVDDEEQIREPSARMLKRRLHADITTVDNGEDGINLAKSMPYDLILLDLHIPKKSGWEVIEEIRKFDPHVFILIITGSGEFTEEQQKIIETKTSGILYKVSFKIEVLIRRIAELLGEEITIDLINTKPDSLKGRPEAREIVHALNGLHGSGRITIDEYFYLLNHGFFKDCTSEQHIERLQLVLKDVHDTLKRAANVVERIRKL